MRLLLLEHREAGALVLDDLVAIGEFINGTLLRFTTEVVEVGDAAISALLRLKVEVVGFAGLFADDGECHKDVLGLVLDLGLAYPVGGKYPGRLEKSCAFENRKSTVFRNRLQRTCGKPHADELAELRHPDAFVAQVRGERAVHFLDVVETDTARFLGLTAVVDAAAAIFSDSGDLANFGHVPGCN